MMRHSWQRRRTSGFSLIEILAVLILMSLILTMVGLSFSRGISGAEVRSAGRDLMAAVRVTRGHAIITREEQRLLFNLEENFYTVPARDNKRIDLPDGMEMGLLTAQSEMESDAEGAIRFFPDGSSTGGRVTLAAGARRWVVHVSWLTGEVSLREGVE